MVNLLVYLLNLSLSFTGIQTDEIIISSNAELKNQFLKSEEYDTFKNTVAICDTVCKKIL